MTTDLSMNEGLERIGTTLQQLIDEAKASLSRIEKPCISVTMMEEEKSKVVMDTTKQQNYVEKRYMQEKKISVAFEQLEQSIDKLKIIPRNNRTTKNTKKTCQRMIQLCIFLFSKYKAKVSQLMILLFTVCFQKRISNYVSFWKKK